MPVGRRNNFNACYRVYQVLMEARVEDDNAPTLAAWSAAFGITEAEFLDERFDTISMLGLLTKQKDLAQLQVEQHSSLPENQRNEAFSLASQAMNVTAVGQQWKVAKQHITDGMLRTLRKCSQEIPEDVEKANETDLAKMRDELTELAFLVQGELEDGALRDFLTQQIAIIRRALLEYYVVGIEAFRNASGQLFAELQRPENIETIKENKNSEYIEKLRSVWTILLNIYATYNALQATGEMISIEDVVKGIGS